MCRAIEEIRRQEREEAWQEAWQMCSEKKDLEMIQKMMRITGCPIVQAMDLLDIPAGNRKRYQALLENQPEAHAAKPSA